MGHIALLEDNEDSAELIQLILADEHTLQWFSHPRRFLEIFTRSRFDLILLDIALPDLDGYTVYKLIRERDVGVPVIIISAHVRPGAIRAFGLTGACEYIAKPILDVDDFRERVRQSVGRCDSA